ncbi:hypothetical protein GQX74_013821 [Glossina fuscipes]|uniref:SFR19-like C-terminal domain-containing protein n=1 Tax=Glossina palpalis gambiensis TaxID=67801 RepID=A0A1B0BLV4_9MUSC|nr:hypothetical protein GQX74_013821 [Glossina fuscipes]
MILKIQSLFIVGKSDDLIKVYDDVPNSAVELQVKDKICHSKSGEIDPHKIKNLIDAYVKKFRAKHKKLNLANTGQVSSAVKCAAYLKKL